MLHAPGVATVSIASVIAESAATELDELAVEEPLEIRVSIPGDEQMLSRSLAVTMRTPGDDFQLAAGFLFTEGIVRQPEDIVHLHSTTANIVEVFLRPTVRINPSRMERQSFVSSSCGVCGKRSIAAVLAVQHHRLEPATPRVTPSIVHSLPRQQREQQSTFDRTGGLHAASLFTASGKLLSQFEDVGRHNALDKLIGAELLAGRIPLSDRLLLVSGRASFELIQKASIAGIPLLAAVGAPSSLAVSLARQSGMTLLGFVREKRFNVYSDAGRMAEVPQLARSRVKSEA